MGFFQVLVDLSVLLALVVSVSVVVRMMLWREKLSVIVDTLEVVVAVIVLTLAPRPTNLKCAHKPMNGGRSKGESRGSCSPSHLALPLS